MIRLVRIYTVCIKIVLVCRAERINHYGSYKHREIIRSLSSRSDELRMKLLNFGPDYTRELTSIRP